MKTWPAYMIVIGILVLYILWLQYCNKPKPCVAGIQKVDTQRIITQYTSGWTKPKPDTIYKVRVEIRQQPGRPPEPVFVETNTTNEVPTYIHMPADTQAILKDYYSTVVYKDSTIVAGDTIRVTDRISQNRIQARQWNVGVSQIQITRTIGSPATVYGQIGFYSSRQELIHGAETSLGYIDRKGRGLELSVLRNDQWRYGLKFHTTLFTFK